MITKSLDFKISENEVGARLDKFLSSKLQEYSRSYLQKLIEDGGVKVNGFLMSKNYKLKEKDDIKVSLSFPEKISVSPDKDVKFKIIFENKDFAVIDKPAGLVVHPSKSHKKETLVNGLLAKWPKIKNVGEDELRPGIVHRLDKETSGVMVVAKTNKIFFWLKDQFKERKLKKKYIALVFGNIKDKKGEITAPIARSGAKQVALGKGRRHGKITKTKEAKTEFKVKKYIDDFTLVEAMPKTGRMHQIRVHFAYIGHPVVGDKKYTSKKTFQKLPFERQFLHAAEISFFLPNGEKMKFSADLPVDLKKCLEGLKNK